VLAFALTIEEIEVTHQGRPEWGTRICAFKSGDYCALIQQQYGITFEQFQGWNPSIDAQCSNLLLGDA